MPVVRPGMTPRPYETRRCDMANLIDHDGSVLRREPKAGPQAPLPVETKAEEPKGTRKGGGPRREASVADHRRRLCVTCGLLGALAVGGLGIGAWQTAQARSTIDAYEGQLVEVVAVQTDVAAGSLISDANLVTVQVPKRYVPGDACTSKEEVSGKVAVTNLTREQPISLSSVQGSASPATIVGAPESGKVAYMLGISGAQAMSPLLHVGDRVDVLVGSSDTQGATVASDVRVIALDGRLSGGTSDGYSTVTLELTDAQAESIFQLTDVEGVAVHLAVPAQTDADKAESQPAATQQQATPQDMPATEGE